MSSTRLEADLKDFLERLGRTVAPRRPGELIVKHRTALVEEEQLVRIIATSADRPIKKAINIYASHLTLPDREQYERAFYFNDFLDQTLQASRLAQGILDNGTIRKQCESFVPQDVAVEGDGRPSDSIGFFFNDWLPNENGRLLAVLAPAGYGKTVLTFELARQMSSRYLAGSPGRRPPFPFLIPFGQYRRIASFDGMVLESLQGSGITDYTAGAFAEMVQQGRVVLILDGFDELLEERPDEARKNLRELIETLEGRGKVVVTARSTFFRTSDEVADFLEYYLQPTQVGVIELQPFGPKQRHEFIEKQGLDKKQSAAVRALVDSSELTEVMGSPLLLRETVEAVADAPEEPSVVAEAGRQKLFQRLEASVYQRERVRHGHTFTDQQQHEFLSGVGKEMLESNSRGFDWDSIRVVALERAGDPGLSESELGRLADHHFLTVRSGESDVQFNHQVFREYFQAQALLTSVPVGKLDWIITMLTRRPLPEEVRRFVAEIDSNRRVPQALIGPTLISTRPSEVLASNIAGLCASYAHPDLMTAFLSACPRDVSLGFQVADTDLSGSDWTNRYLQGMKFTNCKLDEASFADAYISELSLAGTTVGGAQFAEATVDSLTLDEGQRIFGRLAVLSELQRLGAETGLEEATRVRDLQAERRTQIVELVRSRLKRFYLAGNSDTADSKWDSSIQERNILGGVRPAEAKFVKSKLIPRMVGVGVLERTRAHGVVIYNLTNGAEDDARALIERDEITGLVRQVIDRLAGGAS